MTNTERRSDWRDMATAPLDGTRVLLLFPQYPRREVLIGAWHDVSRIVNGRVEYRDASWFIEGAEFVAIAKAQPDGWMPLPAGRAVSSETAAPAGSSAGSGTAAPPAPESHPVPLPPGTTGGRRP